MIKVAYSYGLRRNETRMLDAVGFGRNPDGAEFGEYGAVYVRHGKAKRGSPPKRRSVLTVWPWTTDVLEQWFTRSGRCLGLRTIPRPGPRSVAPGSAWRSSTIASPPTETPLVSTRPGLPLAASLLCAHLIEDGWDPRFVQEQVGHDHASTNSIYTCVSSDFRTRTLRRVLDDMPAHALGSTPGAVPGTSTAGAPELGSERIGGTR
jgi:hypothetical protein